MNNWLCMQLISTHYVMAKQVGYHGNLFGGIMLSWIDEAGAAFACQIADTGRMVTKYISALEFHLPVRPGQLIKIYGRCMRIGKTSLTVEIEARRHSIYNGTQKSVCKCEMVFVRIDGDGEPVPIAPHVKEKISNTKNDFGDSKAKENNKNIKEI